MVVTWNAGTLWNFGKSWEYKVEIIYTPPKINMEHNNGGLEDDFPFQIGAF